MKKKELFEEMKRHAAELEELLKSYMAENGEMKGVPDWDGWLTISVTTNPGHRDLSVYEINKVTLEPIHHISVYSFDGSNWRETPSGEKEAIDE